MTAPTLRCLGQAPGRNVGVYVSDWPTGVRADGRPLVVEDLVLVEEGELEQTNRAAITKIFREIAPKGDWSLEFAKGSRRQPCW